MIRTVSLRKMKTEKLFLMKKKYLLCTLLLLF